MGKRIIQQRRGKGSLTYKSPSHRYRGKIKYRIYDKDEKESKVKGKIIDLIHCPGHSAPLAKIRYEDNSEVLIPASLGMKVNEGVETGTKADIKPGNILPLKTIPEGTLIYNVESNLGKNAFCRSAGSFARVITKSGNNVVIRMPSKKQKSLSGECRATIGIVAGGGKEEKPFIKAGRKWHAMKARNKLYPKTSGVAMNVVDHPFGSGRGRHVGKAKTVPRFAPAGRKVGLLRAKKTGRGK